MTWKPDRVLAIGAAGSAAGEVVPALASRAVRVRGLARREEQRQPVLRRGVSPMRAMFEHYDPAGPVSNDVTLRAVLEHPPRTPLPANQPTLRRQHERHPGRHPRR